MTKNKKSELIRHSDIATEYSLYTRNVTVKHLTWEGWASRWRCHKTEGLKCFTQSICIHTPQEKYRPPEGERPKWWFLVVNLYLSFFFPVPKMLLVTTVHKLLGGCSQKKYNSHDRKLWRVLLRDKLLLRKVMCPQGKPRTYRGWWPQASHHNLETRFRVHFLLDILSSLLQAQ